MPRYMALEPALMAGAFTEPRSDAAAEFEQLRERRIELRQKNRDLDTAASTARAAAEAATATARWERAQFTAVGGPSDDLKVAEKARDQAGRAADRATERAQQANDALEFIEQAISQHLERNAIVLFGELSDIAAEARRATEAALNQALKELTAWHGVSRAQEALRGSLNDLGIRQLRTPHDTLKQLVAQVEEIRAYLPASRVMPAEPVPTPQKTTRRAHAEAA